MQLFTFQYGQIRNNDYKNALLHIKKIYIPVWIYQKPDAFTEDADVEIDLHSSMDRLETFLLFVYLLIYFHLHSSMDRLETNVCFVYKKKSMKFTFQYGQIRNYKQRFYTRADTKIYIPVWIDQKLVMSECTDLLVIIYIPVWIDQKLEHIVD